MLDQVKSNDPKVTDAATEMVALLENLLRLDRRGKYSSVSQLLCEYLEINEQEYDFDHSKYIFKKRLHELASVIEEVNNPLLHQNVKARAIIAIDHFSTLTSPGNLEKPLSQTDILTEKYLTDLVATAPILNIHQPLRKYSDHELSQLVLTIDELLNDNEGGLGGFPSWMETPLRDGLKSLRHCMKHFRFYGYNASIDELFIFKRNLESAFAFVESDAEVNHEKIILYKHLRKVTGVFVASVALIAAPMTAHQTYSYYKHLVEQLQQTAENSQKTIEAINKPLLPAPSCDDE